MTASPMLLLRRPPVGRAVGAVLAVATMVLVVPSVARAVSAAAVAPDDRGPVVLVAAGDPNEELQRGDAGTDFTLRLPEGLACPGDSMHDNWRVQTFMVPAADDLAHLSYGVIGPSGVHQYALYGADESARSYANVLTQANASAGQPGVIAAFVPLDFRVVAGESLPSGTYSVGFACTFFGETASYWHTEIVVTADGGDLAWHLVGAAPSPAESGNGVFWIVVLVAAGLVVAVLVRTLLRRRTTNPSTTKESK